jgi:hypothetical protein
MEIHFTRTTEYVIEVDPDDEEALSAVNSILVYAGVAGDSLYERLDTLFRYDDQNALSALSDSNMADIEGETFVTDEVDADDLTDRWGGPEEDDSDDDDTEPLQLSDHVTGRGFVPASLT